MMLQTVPMFIESLLVGQKIPIGIVDKGLGDIYILNVTSATATSVIQPSKMSFDFEANTGNVRFVMSGLTLDMQVESFLEVFGLFHCNVERIIIQNLDFAFTFSGIKNDPDAWVPITSNVSIEDLVIFTE